MPDKIELTGLIAYDVANPYTIELERGQRGGYGWKIKAHGKDPDEILQTIQKINQELIKQYQPSNNGDKGGF